tara:strand:+ start:466 stop:609 length:144 start_codon:yes stop_codon:yes gene_type:complete
VYYYLVVVHPQALRMGMEVYILCSLMAIYIIVKMEDAGVSIRDRMPY